MRKYLFIIILLLFCSIVYSAGIDENVVLLLHGNGDLSDSSAEENSVTAGNLTIETTIKKFGSGAIALNNGQGSVADNAAFDPGSSDYTMDFWTYSAAKQATFRFPTSGDFNWQFLGSDPGPKTFAWEADDTQLFVGHDTDIQDESWHHVLIERYGDELSIWLDGTKFGTTDEFNTSASLRATAGDILIGKSGAANGYIDEVRYSVGVARTHDSNDPCYSSNGTTFSVPTEEYSEGAPPAADNVQLIVTFLI